MSAETETHQVREDVHAGYFQARIKYLKKKLSEPEIRSSSQLRNPYSAELRVIVFHLSNIKGKDRCVSSATLRKATVKSRR